MSRAAALKRIRLDLRESQAEFGRKRFGVDQSTVARWEIDGPRGARAQKQVDDFLTEYAQKKSSRPAAKKKAA